MHLQHWALFSILFGIMLLLSLIMVMQSRNFFTYDVVVRRFSIMDLELPSKSREVVNIIKGIYQLPPTQCSKTISALKGQLIVDFLFMPFAYLSIFFMCRFIADKLVLHVGFY